MNSDNHDPELSSLSHELKSPLTGIQMMLHLLQDQKVGPLNEKQVMMVDRAKGDCDRLLQAINKHLENLD